MGTQHGKERVEQKIGYRPNGLGMGSEKSFSTQ